MEKQKFKIVQNTHNKGWYLIGEDQFLDHPFPTREEAEAHLRTLFRVVLSVVG